MTVYDTATVTNREVDVENIGNNGNGNKVNPSTENQMSEEASGIRHLTPSPQPCYSSSKDSVPKQTFHVTPPQLEPFPRAGQRKTKMNLRKR
ncbi:hypothetical protein JTB14_013372 [Gonioctena quinquepunctata]|nr:hypothetical protein JTB14_013372 [Gonioctena quinquepunctata]